MLLLEVGYSCFAMSALCHAIEINIHPSETSEGWFSTSRYDSNTLNFLIVSYLKLSGFCTQMYKNHSLPEAHRMVFPIFYSVGNWKQGKKIEVSISMLFDHKMFKCMQNLGFETSFEPF